jgi:hypothetical protein
MLWVQFKLVFRRAHKTWVPVVSDISCPRHKSIRVCKLYEERPSVAWKNLVSSFQAISERNYIDDGPDPFIRADRP